MGRDRDKDRRRRRRDDDSDDSRDRSRRKEHKRDRHRRDRSSSRDRKRRRDEYGVPVSEGWVSMEHEARLKEMSAAPAPAPRPRARRPPTGGGGGDESATQAAAMAAMISARLKANAPKSAEELEAEKKLERGAKAVEDEANRRERVAAWQAAQGKASGAGAAGGPGGPTWTLEDEGEADDDDELLAEFDTGDAAAAAAPAPAAAVSSLKGAAAAELRKKRLEKKRDATAAAAEKAAPFLAPAPAPAAPRARRCGPLEGFLASFSSGAPSDPLDTFLTSLDGSGATSPARSDRSEGARIMDAVEDGDRGYVNPHATNTITMEEILKGAKPPDGGWESNYESESDSEARARGAGRGASEKSGTGSWRAFAALHKDEDSDDEPPDKELGRCFADDGDVMEEGERRRAERSALEVFAEQLKKKELKPVDHARENYVKIRKNFYVVPRALGALSAADVALRRDADEIKVRGKGCPPPIETWGQCGLPDKAHGALVKAFGDHTEPFPIQKQALPALMSGRDVIGIAKTGSGKTLAFVLPLLRHIMDQPPIVDGGDGPVALILAPARELALQIWREAKRFANPLGLRAIAVYGGAKVADQIADLKRGAEIVVATPGRLIDILTMSQGRLIGLRRVSYVVLDEADRMFDMGFEPQIAMILRNARPDRQTALFSATFPRAVEQLARKALSYPLEIVAGGRSVAADTVDQYVELRAEGTKFMRLLQLLGHWFERGSVLIFVDTQLKCDSIYEQLMKAGYRAAKESEIPNFKGSDLGHFPLAGYPALSLHGGKDQADRDGTISDFKSGVATVLVATSVAGRGLDVPSIVCVVNYSAPNHLEDYVHRVGAARAAGTAYTFLDPVNEDAYAPILHKALKQAKMAIPPELAELEEVRGGAPRAKQWASSGYAGRGYKFDDDELDGEKAAARDQRKAMEAEMGLHDPDLRDDDDDGGDAEAEAKNAAARAALAAEAAAPDATALATAPAPGAAAAVMLASRRRAARARTPRRWRRGADGGAAAGAPARGAGGHPVLGGVQTLPGGHCYDELDVNDYPGEARYRATHRDNILRVQEETGCAIIARGQYIAPGKAPEPGQKRLYLALEAKDELSIKHAKAELALLGDARARDVRRQARPRRRGQLRQAPI
ncbi:helicase [Aureococcus anophagefferens]|nr:helicase [Aureococcus anophagefferens]